MLTLNRYILKKCFFPFFFGLGGFIIFVSLTLLYNLSEDIIRYEIPAWRLLQLLFFYLPEFVTEAIPVGVFLSIFWVLSDLGTSNELVALQVHGISLKRLVFPFVLFGLLWGGVTFGLGNWVVPFFHLQKATALEKIMDDKKFSGKMIANEPSFIGENRYLYVQRPLSDNELKGVFVYSFQSAEVEVLYARYALLSPQADWTLREGQLNRFDGDFRMPLSLLFGETNFAEIGTEIQERVGRARDRILEMTSFGETYNPFKYKTLAQLLEYMETYVRAPIAVSTIQNRLSMSVGPIVIVLMAVPISLILNLKSKSRTIILTFVLIGAYKLLTTFLMNTPTLSQSNRYYLSPYTAAWFPNVLFGGFGIVLFALLNTRLLFRILETFRRR